MSWNSLPEASSRQYAMSSAVPYSPRAGPSSAAGLTAQAASTKTHSSAAAPLIQARGRFQRRRFFIRPLMPLSPKASGTESAPRRPAAKRSSEAE